MREMYAVNQVVAAVDPSFAQLIQVNNHGYGILAWHASAAQQEAYFPKLVSEGLLVGIAGSEAKIGSADSGNRGAELAESDSGWHLTTTKYFASLGPGAAYYLVMAAIPGSAPYNERQVFVMVPTDAPEVTLEDNWDAMGMRSTVSWTLRIEGLPVSSDQIIGEPGGWLRDPRSFTCGYVSNHLGAARGALDFARDWVRARPSLSASEIVRNKLADMAARVTVVQSAFGVAVSNWERAAAMGWDQEACDDAELLSLQILHQAKHEAMFVISSAFEICGARSAFKTFPLEQLLRDTRTFTLHSRDELLMSRVADTLLSDESFSVKGLNISPDGVADASA